MNVYGKEYKFNEKMNRKIFEALNLNYESFSELLILKNYDDLEITKNNIIYKFNYVNCVWERVDNKQVLLRLIKNVIDDFYLFNG